MKNKVSKFRYWRTKKVVEKLVLQTYENHFIKSLWYRFGATHPRKNMRSLNSCCKRSNWKMPQHLSFEIKKIHAGVKLNYVYPPMVLTKIFDRSIKGIATENYPKKISKLIVSKSVVTIRRPSNWTHIFSFLDF